MDSSQCDFQGVSVPDMAFIINDQRSIEKIKNKYNTDGVEKWLDEENFIQQMKQQFQEKIQKKEQEISYLRNQLDHPIKKVRYCSKCCKAGHRKDKCKNQEASREEKLSFQSKRIVKYKLKRENYSEIRAKTQSDYYQKNKVLLQTKSRDRMRKLRKEKQKSKITEKW